MTLRDYILTYKTNDKVVVNLFDYYERYIKVLDKRFNRYSFYHDKLVLCWFKDHADVNPSMGYIYDKHRKGVLMYHCFGCNRTGDVVRLHQIIMSTYHNRDLTEKESCFELAELFHVPVDDFEEAGDEEYELQHLKNMRRVEKLQSHYCFMEFRDNLRGMRERGLDLNALNSECIKMIATSKKLYD